MAQDARIVAGLSWILLSVRTRAESERIEGSSGQAVTEGLFFEAIQKIFGKNGSLGPYVSVCPRMM